MKRTVAIVLTLILLGIQAMTAVQTTALPTPASCGCCAPEKACCCVVQSAPEAVPLPATRVVASTVIDFTAMISKVVAWTLPVNAPATVFSTDNFALSPTVPLFTRHCALLI